jgi:hypothetical protein
MAQQFPPNGGGRGGHGGRGPPPGGRGPGRGIPSTSLQQQHPQQQQQASQPQPYNFAAGGSGRGGPRPVSAWQPSQPTSLQQASGYPVVQGLPQQGHVRPVAPGGYAPMGAMPYYNPYATGGALPYAPRADPNQWQGQPSYAQVPHQQQAMRGGVYYPPGSGPPVVNAMPSAPAPQSQISQPIAPRKKMPLQITVRMQM